MQRAFRPNTQRLVGNAGELCNAIRFARKDQMPQCSEVMVGASAHNTA